MNTPLAWKNLVHNKVRTAVALAGVAFAVILIFMQLGFKNAVRKTATQIYDALDFDLMLRSPEYLHLTDPGMFPKERIYQAESLPEVEIVRPLYLGLSEWQRPQSESIPDSGWEGQWRGIICMGADPNDPPFARPDIRRVAQQLTDPRFVAMDTKSKPEFGPANGRRFSSQDFGVETILGGGRVQIVGIFELGTGLACNGACLVSPEGYATACYWQPADQVNLGLARLAPGADPLETQERLQALLGAPDVNPVTPQTSATPADVEVLTRAEVIAREEFRWVEQTPLGKIFTFGVWVAMFVGVAIVYQVLSTDIANMMGEYATLKAMGYPNKFLTRVVLEQSVLLALIGYVPSLVISWILYQVVGAWSGMPMILTPTIAGAVLMLAVVMCVLSGLAALRKLFQADPADLF
ncbi:MAG: FtsX-like permease family protein [Planctomycetales bacterium]|nr:FtsX-like permease family protein [Planctomycetales bacterium]